jgi:hypothetical protein
MWSLAAIRDQVSPALPKLLFISFESNSGLEYLSTAAESSLRDSDMSPVGPFRAQTALTIENRHWADTERQWGRPVDHRVYRLTNDVQASATVG